jgi:hypothetical protein
MVLVSSQLVKRLRNCEQKSPTIFFEKRHFSLFELKKLALGVKIGKKIGNKNGIK